MKQYSLVTKISIVIFAVIHVAIFMFFSSKLLTPYKGWIVNDSAMNDLMLGTLSMCISAIAFIYSFFLLVVKYSQDSWGAGMPIAISSITWVLIFFVLPFVINSLDIPFRLFQNDYEESARIVINIESKEKVELPEEYRHISVTGGVYLINGRIFYMQSVGMMAEYGPGYLYDPTNKPEEVCTKSSKIFFVQNWYECNLDWGLFQ